MRSISRTRQRTLPVTCSIAFTLALWLGSKWYFQDWFADPFKYPAKAASLSATVLMCWCILLSTRWRFLEKWFHGLDKVYQVHKRLGRLAFFIILLHPLCLGLDQLPDLVGVLRDMWFRVPEGDTYLWGQNLGVAALLVMALLVALTLWVRPPYHLWKHSHEWFGLVLVMVAAHILLVDADIAAYPLLRLWMYGLLLLALAAFIYIRFLYRFLGPHFRYRVSRIEKIEDLLELTFTPVEEKMDFKPSQFVYLSVKHPDISPELHPYSIACGYNLAARFKLGIKQVGDHTRSLDRLTTGDPVTVYGPYGRFSEPFLSGERDCLFIGGGIGITPFLGMWHVALHSEERLPEHHVPEPLRQMHPEIIRSWKSPRVALFYVCRTRLQASFDRDIKQEALLSHFHGFTSLAQRGHHYELFVSSEQGRFSAEYLEHQLGGSIWDRNVFLCGPTPMMDGLTSQLLDRGVPPERIITEDFNLV